MHRIRSPRKSTFFPYTTLFRSDQRERAAGRDRGDDGCFDVDLRGREPAGARLVETSVITAISDRKSTRLNSSHTVISYAVFCLKKKIIIIIQRLVSCDN